MFLGFCTSTLKFWGRQNCKIKWQQNNLHFKAIKFNGSKRFLFLTVIYLFIYIFFWGGGGRWLSFTSCWNEVKLLINASFNNKNPCCVWGSSAIHAGLCGIIYHTHFIAMLHIRSACYYVSMSGENCNTHWLLINLCQSNSESFSLTKD